MTSITEALNWRYATKKFDPAKKVSEADVNELLEAARLAPSSYGLQPWTFVIVTNPELRKKLREHAWNQPQITDASHLIVLATRTDLDENYIKKYVKKIAEVRKVPVDSLKSYEDMMAGDIAKRPQEERINWGKRQTYIALGFLLFAAVQKRIDACPMEGFDAEKFDEVLGLKKMNLTATVLCAVGYRASDDVHSQHAKVRFSKSDVVIEK